MTTVKEAGLATIDMKLEVIVIPVSDAARAEQFYRNLGWRQDVTPPGSGVFQFTPHGSACSVQFGKGLTSAAPGSAQRTYLIVSDIEATRNALVDSIRSGKRVVISCNSQLLPSGSLKVASDR